MRLVKIRIRGYKRLADASCNLDSRVVALVGPNEAGKSSVLEALAWLSRRDSGPLDGPSRSRSLPSLSDTTPVVECHFSIDDGDRLALQDIPTDAVARKYILRKMPNGDYEHEVQPHLNLPTKPFAVAGVALDRLEALASILSTGDDLDGTSKELLVSLRGLCQDPDQANRKDAASSVEDVVGTIEASAVVATSKRKSASLRRAGLAIAALLPLLQGDHPQKMVLDRLWARVPDFLPFEERDRVLNTEYNLGDATLYSSTPRALENLLALAGTSLGAVQGAQQSGDVTRIRTLVKTVNSALSERLQPTWRQSALTVAVEIDGSMLQVLVNEIRGNTVTAIHERSDGLRTFIALVCFLARHRGESNTPPVLMLDEAETHLHYDAQADLVDVLTSHVDTDKVIYTTHSPGCLPHDLGTGIRLVSPNGDTGVSVLRNDFWATNEAGFSPLLFAMGAGAAAFSVCRRAVLAEGPSDMIVLPTLIRIANNCDELGYQIAPGLSVMQLGDPASVAIAARMAYLVDGDPEGQRYLGRLKEVGVPEERIFSLPAGCAVEDLIEVEDYLSAVNQLVLDAGWTGALASQSEFDGRGPISGQLGRWCEANGAPCPSKTAVATRLIQEPSAIQLTLGARHALAALHSELKVVLN